MKFEERVKSMRQTKGTMVFMNAIIDSDIYYKRRDAWLLTFGLLDTFKIVKGISDNDNTF